MAGINARMFMLIAPVAFGFLTAGCTKESTKLVGVPPAEVRKLEGSELQTFSPSVDVLFVIDDSGSMYTHQMNLKNNVGLLTSGLSTNKFVDYHIGVITTSSDFSSTTNSGGGILVGVNKFIDRSTPFGMDILKANIMAGTSGSGMEMIFDPIVSALTEPILSHENSGFYRPSAYLAIVVITDAEDQSIDFEAGTLQSFLVNDLKHGDSSKLLTYGVIIPTNDTTNCSRDEYGSPPLRIEEFFNLTKGTFYGLCDTDYGTKLARIGSDLVERIGRRVLLDRRPIVSTIQVQYGTQAILPDAENGWSYDASDNAVVLGRKIKWTEQPSGTVVQVNFKPVQN